MPTHYPELEQILAYVEGKMTLEEKAAFELIMAADEGLMVEVGEMKMYAQSQKTQNELKSHTATVSHSIKNQSNSGRATRIFPGIYAIAAGLVLLIAVSFWLSGNSGNTREQAQGYLAWNAQTEVRGNSQNTLFSKAIAKGGEENWNDAIPLLESALQMNPSFVEAQLYLGRAYLLSGNNEKGIQILSAIISDSTSLPNTKLDAHWFRGLGRLFVKECESAEKDLNIVISTAGNLRKKKALTLLETCK